MTEPVDAAVAAIRDGDAAALSELAEAHPDLGSAPAPGGASLLLFACYHRREDLAAILRAGRTELSIFEAAALGESNALATPIEAEPKRVHEFSPDGFTALHLAAYFGREACVRVLLALGADPRTPAANPLAMTPLHSAVAGRHHAVAALLLEAGADPDAVQHGGWTPLHGAALHGDETLVRMLLEAGATRDPRGGDGRTPAAMARGAGFEEVAALLE